MSRSHPLLATRTPAADLLLTLALLTLPPCALPVCLAGCGGDEGPDETADAEPDAEQPDAGPASEDAGAGDAAPDAAPQDAGPPTSTAEKIAELKFAVPVIWADPLKQYLVDGHDKVGHWSFRRAVHDLAVYQGRLYMGYGDADNNLGQVTPIACRYWDDPAVVETKDEFKVDEEEIQRYRHIGDELWIAGVDATEDAWLGNVYRRTPAGPWVKLRAVPNGVHVHDVATWQGALWAVGSGAEPAKWKEGNIWGHLWRSADMGKSWEIVAKHWNAQDGDARWVALLPVKDLLYVFGYWITQKGSLSLPNGTVKPGQGEASVESFSVGNPLKTAFITEAWPIDADRGIVAGRDFLKSPAANGAWLVSGAAVTPLEAFAGMTVIDVFVHQPSGEIVVLTRDTDVPDDAFKGEVWQIKVWLSADLKTWEKLLDFPAGDRAVSVAWWKGTLYFGSHGGQVWRSAASWR